MRFLSILLTRPAWIGLLIGACGVMGLGEYLESDVLNQYTQLDQLYTFKVIVYVNLVLVASTVLYVWHSWFGSETVGKWASRLAELGAVGLVLTLLVRWGETYYLQRPGHIPLNAMYEMMALFSAITIVIYLVMEKIFRTRSAGAFVMVIVLGAVLFQIWLISSGQAVAGKSIPLLRSYWMYVHVLGDFIGYGAFAVAAAMGAAYLVRSRAEAAQVSGIGGPHGFAMHSLPALRRIDESMHRAILLGFPLFSIGTVLGGMWACEAWGSCWAWDPKETWSLLVWLTYASYFYFRYVSQWSGKRMAWWAIAGFGMTVFCFLGVRALWPGVHSFG